MSNKGSNKVKKILGKYGVDQTKRKIVDKFFERTVPRGIPSGKGTNVYISNACSNFENNVLTFISEAKNDQLSRELGEYYRKKYTDKKSYLRDEYHSIIAKCHNKGISFVEDELMKIYDFEFGVPIEVHEVGFNVLKELVEDDVVPYFKLDCKNKVWGSISYDSSGNVMTKEDVEKVFTEIEDFMKKNRKYKNLKNRKTNELEKLTSQMEIDHVRGNIGELKETLEKVVVGAQKTNVLLQMNLAASRTSSVNAGLFFESQMLDGSSEDKKKEIKRIVEASKNAKIIEVERQKELNFMLKEIEIKEKRLNTSKPLNNQIEHGNVQKPIVISPIRRSSSSTQSRTPIVISPIHGSSGNSSGSSTRISDPPQEIISTDESKELLGESRKSNAGNGDGESEKPEGVYNEKDFIKKLKEERKKSWQNILKKPKGKRNKHFKITMITGDKALGNSVKDIVQKGTFITATSLLTYEKADKVLVICDSKFYDDFEKSKAKVFTEKKALFVYELKLLWKLLQKKEKVLRHIDRYLIEFDSEEEDDDDSDDDDDDKKRSGRKRKRKGDDTQGPKSKKRKKNPSTKKSDKKGKKEKKKKKKKRK